MRVRLVFICIGLFTWHLGVTAQTVFQFPQPGMEQGEIYHGDWANPGMTKIKYWHQGDTVINNVNYSAIRVNGIGGGYYTHYDNGAVYLYTRDANGSIVGGGLLLYDFNLGINDTFPSITLNFPIVDSVGIVQLGNGQARKYLELRSSTRRFKWIDGIGDIERGFTYYRSFDGDSTEFICNRDSSGLVYLKPSNTGNWTCDSLISITEDTHSWDRFEVYPNPANNWLTIRMHEQIGPHRIVLYDQLGRTIFLSEELSEAEFSFDISFLKAGFYRVVLEDGMSPSCKTLLVE